jgi:hypothetical protein
MQLDTVVYINPNAYDDKLVSSDRYDIDIVSSDWHVPITNSESDNPMLNAYTNQPNVECVLTEIKPMSNAYRNLKMSNACRNLKMSNFKQKTNSVQAQTDEIKNQYLWPQNSYLRTDMSPDSYLRTDTILSSYLRPRTQYLVLALEAFGSELFCNEADQK